MEWVAFVAGGILVLWTAASVVRTLVLPRALSSSITTFVGNVTRGFFLFMANRFDSYEPKDTIMAFMAPTYLLALLFTWLNLFFVGYA